MTETGMLRGRLLVAATTLGDPNFNRTVVLVCNHDDDGALGVILNRVTEAAVADFLPAWAEYVSLPDRVFVGGPVQRETAVAVADLPLPPDGDAWVPIVGTVGLVDLTLDPAALPARPAGLRVFSGYAGWSSGQLEMEIEDGDWFVVPAVTGDPFTVEHAVLWRSVLRRQSLPLRLYADFPPDPRLN